MKKQIKKLLLSKETLRNLSGEDMRMVDGGVTVALSCGGSCNNNSCEATCFSCWCTDSGCPRTMDC
jgi:hypothetical protein